VYDASRGGWAQDVIIIPGTDSWPAITAPLGQFTDVGSMVGRASNWDLDGDGLLTQQESAGDLALIGLKSRIGDVTGWLPLADAASDFNGVMAGYPVRGTGLMAESVLADASASWGVYDIASGLGPGASGGPLLYTANGVTSVAGVLSGGNVEDTMSTYAGLFGAGTLGWLQQAIASDDTLIGLAPGSAPTSATMVFMGTSSAEQLTGTAAADVFTGLGGNDTIDGGVGTDTAAFSGTRASHTVTIIAPNKLVVSDQVAGRDGTDTLWNVERLTFSDVSLAFDIDGNAGKAFRIYQVALDRAPDAGGLGYFMRALDNGGSLRDVANAFFSSAEFQAKYGPLDNSAFVTQLYENALHRAPDAAGLAYFVASLDRGAGTRADVLFAFSESAEEHSLLMGVMQQGMTYV
jgi:hypothetical protein